MFIVVFSLFPWGFPGVFSGFSQGFPGGFQGFSLGFPGVSLGFSWGFPSVFPGFSRVFPGVSPGFSRVCPGISRGFSFFLFLFLLKKIVRPLKKKNQKITQPLKNCIGPTLLISKEILCLQYAGFFFTNNNVIKFSFVVD